MVPRRSKPPDLAARWLLAAAGAGGSGLSEPPAAAPPRDGEDVGDRGGGGGDGGGGDDGPPAGSPGRKPGGISTRDLAFFFLLTAIGALFVAFLAMWLYFRRTAPEWPPPGVPRAPDGLWGSTALLGAGSLALVRAVGARRAARSQALRRWLVAAWGLGVAFLVAQAWLWRGLLAAGLDVRGPFGMLFYSLTGLHALHALAGVVYLGRVALVDGVRSLDRGGRSSVEYCAAYWHFLGVLWLILFGALYLVDRA